MYKNKEELLELLKKEHLWSQKQLGQNFLINHSIIDAIIKAAELKKNDDIIEVGPGLGILTEELLERAGHVRSIELDPKIIPYLKKTFGRNTRFELEEGTALKAKLPAKPYKLVANIPYYITSPLLRHFLQPKEPAQKSPTLIVLLVQKEVAEKICAQDGEHTILSLQVQVFGKPSIVQTVDASSFYPAPKVDSAILKVEVYKEPRIQDLKLFSTITRIAFHQRRKTLGNTIKNHLQISREEVDQLFETINIDPSQRPQELSLGEWTKLITSLKPFLST